LHENERQRQSILLDAVKTEKQQQEKIVLQLKKEAHLLHTELATAKLALQTVTEECDAAVKSSADKNVGLAKAQKTVENLQENLSELHKIKQDITEQTTNTATFFASQEHVNQMIEKMLNAILHRLEQKKVTEAT
jgi:CO/xanthine dehydrogenase FAD-binding subunit